jgi:hypothetical protein
MSGMNFLTKKLFTGHSCSPEFKKTTELCSCISWISFKRLLEISNSLGSVETRVRINKNVRIVKVLTNNRLDFSQFIEIVPRNSRKTPSHHEERT